MATPNLQIQAMSLIDEIHNLSQSMNHSNMCKTIKKFTELLYSNRYLIYSDINEHFEKIGLTGVLIKCLAQLPDQLKRDVLRLLHLFLKTNANLRNQAAMSEDFMKYLSDTLEKVETWSNTPNFKYHIHIAAHIIIDSVVPKCFKTNVIRQIVRQKIDEFMFSENKLIYIVFYACSKRISSLEDVALSPEDEKADLIVSKEIIGIFIDVVRDYLDDFKTFYKDTEFASNQYLLYRLKSEFSFDQICQTIIYFAVQSEKLRMNIFESGFYELESNIFIIKNVPNEFLHNALEVFKIPTLDPQIKQKFIICYQRIFDRLSNMIRNGSVSTLIKNSVLNLFNLYNVPKPSSNVLITLPSNTTLKDSNFLSIDRWGSLDVDNWLAENNLEEFRKKFSGLTGRGLKQMKKLTMDEDGKLLVIDLLLTKLDINVIMVFEFLGALENLE